VANRTIATGRTRANRSRATGRARASGRSLAIPAAASPVVNTGLSLGGGYTASGIVGTYYPNTTFSSSPSFTRNDVRIDMNWGTLGTPGGSTSPGFSALGNTGWSCSWSGSVVFQFTETYTFTIITNAAVKLVVNGTTVIAQTAATSVITSYTGTFAGTSGSMVTLVLPCAMTTSPAAVTLQWSSPSTPQCTIEPCTQVGLNGSSCVDYDAAPTFADAMKQARIYQSAGGGAIPIDSNGWPTSDGSWVLMAGQPTDTSGYYTMTFTGQATVTFGSVSYTIISNNYNSGTNTTVIVMNAGGGGAISIAIANSKRLPSDTPPTGITNISIMRPLTAGATSSYPAGSLFHNEYKSLLAQVSCIRFMDYFAMNSGSGEPGGNAIINWSDRMFPGYAEQSGGTNPGYQGAGGAIEYAVQLCNETGKDLWFNMPLQATTTFMTNVANLLKYGSDASGNPYTSVQASPVYPPLNPNLKVYLELSNEVWNGEFYQNTLSQNLAAAAIAGSTAQGLRINYDGLVGSGQPSAAGDRWQSDTTVLMSMAFRSVYGSGMMQTIRPTKMFQYANGGDTAIDQIEYIRNYYNNEDGSNVGSPQPIGYYLYGAGGGWYNTVNNNSGTGAITIAHPNFDAPVVTTNTASLRPAASGWTFTGTSGIVNGSGTITIGSLSTTVPAPPTGSQVGYIQGAGTISQSITFPADVCGIQLQLAPGDNPSLGAQQITIDIDGTVLENALTPGYGAFGGYYSYYTYQAINLTAGAHTLTLTGSGTGTVLVSEVTGLSTAPIFSSGAQSIASQTVIERNWCIDGLQCLGYEGGWNIGDSNATPVCQAANVNSQSQALTLDTIQEVNAGGMLLPITFAASSGPWSVVGTPTYGIPDLDYSSTPKMAGINQASDALPAANTNVTAVPGTLNSTNLSNYNGATNYGGPWATSSAQCLLKSGWISWNFSIPATSIYGFTVTTTVQSGSGGYSVVVDGVVTATGTAGTPLTFTSGTLYPSSSHTIRIRSTGTAVFTIVSVVVVTPPTPPVINSATPSGTSVTFGLTAGTGGGLTYNLYVGSSSGGESATPFATGLTGTSPVVTGFAASTLYYGIMKAVNAAGVSVASNETSFTTGSASPNPPTKLQSIPANGTNNLSWVAPVSGPTPTGYKIYRATTSGGQNYTSALATVSAVLVYADVMASTGGTNNVAYYYTVESQYSGNASTPSNEAIGVAPTTLKGIYISLLADLYEDLSSGTTTPATTNGNPVGTWVSADNNGHPFTTATSGDRMTLATNTTVTPNVTVVRSDGVAEYLQAAIGSGTAPYSMIFVGSIGGNDSNQPGLLADSNGAMQWQLTPPQEMAIYAGNFGISSVGPSNDNVLRFYACIINGASTILQRDQTNVYTPGDPGTNTVTNYVIGQNSGTFNANDQAICIMLDEALNSTQLGAWYLYAQWWIPGLPTS